ncbi:hypothetical protein, partial [Staphylococcus aureus]|uniref:hypothetical protein n=1 Tax=Staphylococcus aureus TaxID=1280 RepID=UPI003AAB5AB9
CSYYGANYKINKFKSIFTHRRPQKLMMNKGAFVIDHRTIYYSKKRPGEQLTYIHRSLNLSYIASCD